MRVDRLSCGVLAVLLSWPALAHAYCRLTTTQPIAGKSCSTEGTPLTWTRQCIDYSVVPRDREPPSLAALRDVIDVSFETWMHVRCDGQPLPLSIVQTQALSRCDQPQYNDLTGNVNSVMFLRDWRERALPGEAFGLTLVWHDEETGEIVDADMELNETLGALDICDKRCAEGVVDLQNIITHEAGHFLGLGHSEQATASMWGMAQVGELSKRYLTSDDEAGLCDAYGGPASPVCDEAAYEPNNGFDPDCRVPRRYASESCGVVHAGAGLAPPLRSILVAGSMIGVVLWRRRRRRDVTAT